MTNNNQTNNTYVFDAEPDEVSAILGTVAYNKPVIEEFFNTLSPQEALNTVAWFLGMVLVQKPDMEAAFTKALGIGKQIAVAFLTEDELKNAHNTDFLYLIYPPMPTPDSRQGSILDDSSTLLIQ